MAVNLALVLDPKQTWTLRSTASNALDRSDAREQVIASVVRAIDDAVQSRDGLRAVLAGSVGARIPAQATFEGVTRVLSLLGGLTRAEGKLDAERVEEGVRMIGALRDAGHDPDVWIQEALCRPDTCGFSIAAAASKGEAAPPIRKLLHDALGSESRDGAAAAEAAQALVDLAELGTRSPRLQRVFSRAPLEDRAHLLRIILLQRIRRRTLPLGPIWTHVAELLTTKDERVLPAVREVPWIVIRGGADRERLRRIYEKIVDPEVRSVVAMALEIREKRQRERYWLDGEEE